MEPKIENLSEIKDLPLEERVVKKNRMTDMVEGFKQGVTYLLDPSGVFFENFENMASNGKDIDKNYTTTAFQKMSEKAHKTQSIERYLGTALGVGATGAVFGFSVAGLGLLFPALTLGGAAVGSLATLGTFGYNIYKTSTDPHKDWPKSTYHPGFGKGFKAGFGYAIDPFGLAAEQIERNLVNGKGMDSNNVITVSQEMSYDMRQGHSIRKYFGLGTGAVVGCMTSAVTWGILPVVTGIADIVKTSKYHKKRSD